MVKLKGPRDLPRFVPPTPSDGGGKPRRVLWPSFATFGNPKDPKTVRVLTPDEVGVKRITMEITDEPITKGIDKRLPSFGPRTRFDKWVQTLHYGDARLAVLSGFSRERDDISLRRTLS